MIRKPSASLFALAALCVMGLVGIASAQHPVPPKTNNGMYDQTGWTPIALGSCTGEGVGCTTVYGFDWMSDGRMVLLTNDYIGHDQKPAARPRAKVSIITNPSGTSPTVTTIASHFKQPGGVTVVNDKIWVPDMDTVYVIPNNNPAPADTLTNRTPKFGAPLSTMHGGNNAPYNFAFNKATCGTGLTGCTSTNSQAHHYIFTPVYYQGKFYASYGGATGSGNGAANLNASSFYAGAMLMWDSATTTLDTIANRSLAGGMRSPNGTALGPNGSIFVTDHQGSYLPMNTLTRYRATGAPKMQFGGYRQDPTYSANFAQAWYDRGQADYVPPLAINRYDQSGKTGWVGIAQPYYLTQGPYAGQLLVGDINSRGLWRVAIDTLNDTTNTQNMQGTVFYFTPGSTAATTPMLGTGNSGNNRITQGPDGTIYVGGGRGVGNWASGVAANLIYVYKPKANPTQFEIMTIRSLGDGYELVLNRKVDPKTVSKSKFSVGQRSWVRQSAYGLGFAPANASGGTTGASQFTDRTIDSVQVSLDSMRIRLKVSGILRLNQGRRGDSVTHWHTRFLFDTSIAAANGSKIYTTEADYAQNWINTSRTWTGGALAPTDTVVSLRPARMGMLANNVWLARAPGVIRVNVDNMSAPYHVSLRDVAGKVLFRSGEIAAHTRATEIKSPGATQGVYTIEVRSGAEAYSKIVTF
jgi:hypothetical protein